MVRKKTDAEFKKEVYDLVGDEYTFIEHYRGTHSKIRIKHNKCGNVYEVKPNAFLNGRRCPYCAGLIRKTDDQFKKEIKNLVGNEYTFLEPYVNNKTELRVKHNKCSHVYNVTPNSFLRGHRCPFCSITTRGKARRKTDTQFKKEVFDLVGNKYTFLDPYINTRTKIKVKHNLCGNTYEVKPNDFLNGKRCPYCAGLIKKTDIQFSHEVKNLVGNKYTFLDPYVNSKTKLRVRHNKCGHVYKVRPTDFISQSSRCPYCNTSKGELIINKILKSMEIEYEYQKTFDDLKDTNLLSYDFYIPDQAILIEYQGQQHYEPVDHFGGDITFEKQQEHDKMKANYAKTHHYNLITVPYTEDTFSKIKKCLLQHGLKLSA